MLFVVCFIIPRIIKFFKKVKNENKYLKKWFSDVHLRINVSLYASLIWNVALGVFQLILGFYHKSFWFYSMCAYYVMLGAMRIFLVKLTRKYKVKEELILKLKNQLFVVVCLLL